MQEKWQQLQTKRDVLLLGIESSCDETACAVVRNGREILSNVILSQIEIHRLYGGVVPEIASRNHVEAIDVVCKRALQEAGVSATDLDAVAVTYGAGLVGALLVGVSFAKAFAQALQIPLVAVNHIEGHICANYLTHPQLQPPYLCLLTSGGHTALVKVSDYTSYEVLASTVDDAVGEAFDKVARCLSLPYPGGPQIDRLAKDVEPQIRFHSALLPDGNFSYSGLKTGVINYLHRAEQRGEPVDRAQVAAAFTRAALDGLVTRTVQECEKQRLSTLAVAGGVGANSYLRERLRQEGEKHRLHVLLPRPDLCTDNAAMIASQGYYLARAGQGKADLTLNAMPTLKLRFSVKN